MFLAALKNHHFAEWTDHEVRYAKLIEAISQITSLDELKEYQPSTYELRSLYQEISKSVEGIKPKCKRYIHLLKDMYQSERRKILHSQTSGQENIFL